MVRMLTTPPRRRRVIQPIHGERSTVRGVTLGVPYPWTLISFLNVIADASSRSRNAKRPLTTPLAPWPGIPLGFWPRHGITRGD